MILVVCPNLAVDVTLEVESLRVGDVHRARQSERQAGGKGVNLARAATTLKEHPHIIGFAGGRRGEEIRALLDNENIESDLIEVSTESRVCTIVLEPSGTATVINEPGTTLETAEATAKGGVMVERVRGMLDDVQAVALMGSLQPGLSPTLYREIVTLCRRAGKLCLVDTSGAALREALAAGPTFIKPNRAEAEALLERRLDGKRAFNDALEELRRTGTALAVLTLGADGVVFSCPESVARCCSPPVDLRYGNPTGAGDALAAGMLAGHLRGLTGEETVRFGVAAATASLARGYGRFRAKDLRLDPIRIESLN